MVWIITKIFLFLPASCRICVNANYHASNLPSILHKAFYMISRFKLILRRRKIGWFTVLTMHRLPVLSFVKYFNKVLNQMWEQNNTPTSLKVMFISFDEYFCLIWHLQQVLYVQLFLHYIFTYPITVCFLFLVNSKIYLWSLNIWYI